MKYTPWGNFPNTQENSVPLNWTGSPLPLVSDSCLPRGLGRSYGDSCLNSPGLLLDCTPLNHFLSFDSEQGILKAEAGVTLQEIIENTLPKGWFLPVTPGTKFVTLGGAIANDVHGKNHHIDGCFGNHVLRFELVRSNGERHICSPTENRELFRATIGGLGLTGLITWVEFQLKKVTSANIDVETIKFHNLKEFFEISEESKNYLYTVSWVDCLATGDDLGRGLFMRGQHSSDGDFSSKSVNSQSPLNVPFNLPSFLLNGLTMQAFNTLYYNKQFSKLSKSKQNYNPFFYPLDAVRNWNRIYGRNGFLQYQFVVPHESGQEVVEEIFKKISDSRMGSFLAVLKNFGKIKSPGLLSFPREGVTLALDFAIKGPEVFQLLEELDKIIISNHGRIYPAKDARMSTEMFKASFPNLDEFLKWKDPNFSSLFFRRVMGETKI
ncbi:MAG: FAD-binding oxidoreductase [Bdellovibrionaceae bacterium]|nr:FAD-binding oxidoreductase [Pseudobdellovibrionaceae bacterium]|tara:strand:- start:60578 stop:61888 length:1311 start_codon:yes stop_codon:yes gene_type:complete